MTLALIIFASCFFDSLLGCLQVINISKGHKIWALCISVCIGISKLTMYRSVPHITHFWEVLAFICGGLSGAQLSMMIKRRHLGK